MNLKKILLFGAVALLLLSCSKEDQVSAVKSSRQDGKTAKFFASAEGTAPGTKIYADEDLRVLWNENDYISIFNYANVNDKYVFDGEDGDNSGSFSFEEEGPDPSVPVDLEHIYAVYPYSASTEAFGGGLETIAVDLPADQLYREHSFGVGANTMVAVTDNNFLGFKNVCGYLRFRFYGDNVTVKSITLEGNNGEKIAGSAVITPSVSAAPSVSMQGEATGKITINCPAGMELGTTSATATEFIFVVPPTTFSGGFKVTVTGANGGTFEKSSTRSLTISRNKIESMGAMKVELSAPDYVEFEDDTFKAYCVANFDVDGDGEISKAEAMAVDMIQCFNSSPSHDYYYEEQGGKRYDYMYATSLKGIEEFENLQTLNIAGSSIEQGPLTSLDLSQNTALKTAWIYNNDISDLDISGCTLLEDLNCSNTRIGEIYVFGFEKLESLIATDCSYLEFINCGYCTSLSELDITGCGNLNWIDCASTLLTSLDLSNRTLRYVNCSDCSQLGTLKLEGSSVSNTITWKNCPEIKNFLFSGAEIANWPTEGFTGMTYLTLVNLDGSNYSGSLNLSNKQYLQSVMAGNTDIIAIYVNNDTAIYNFDCSNSKVTSLSLNDLTNLNMFSCLNCTDLQTLQITECDVNSVYWTGCSGLNTLNLAGTAISTWPAGGFSVFPALQALVLHYANYDSALDLTGNTALQKLQCIDAGITSINVSGLSNLTEISCAGNNLTSGLDLSGLSALRRLSCYECNLPSLNVTGCTALKNVYASQNNLTAITGLSSLTALTDLNFAENKIESIDIHNNTALTKVTAWPQNEGFSLHLVVLTPTQVESIAWWDTTHQLTNAEIAATGTLFDTHY